MSPTRRDAELHLFVLLLVHCRMPNVPFIYRHMVVNRGLISLCPDSSTARIPFNCPATGPPVIAVSMPWEVGMSPQTIKRVVDPLQTINIHPFIFSSTLPPPSLRYYSYSRPSSPTVRNVALGSHGPSGGPEGQRNFAAMFRKPGPADGVHCRLF